MKRLIATLLLALALNVTGTVTMARAEIQSVPASDDYDDSQSHPLRLAAYLLHPFGYTLEWLIFRPFHRLVSEPGAERVFGHRDHSEDSTIGGGNL